MPSRLLLPARDLTATNGCGPLVKQAAVVSGTGIKYSWDIKYLYDGECRCADFKHVFKSDLLQ